MTQQQALLVSSDDTIQDFDSHIKVSAGPGAGKTTWLAGHIFHVARSSKRLHKAARIACISYTNAASEAIRAKLGQCADIVDTSTIHSFLFANLVRPYLHILTDDSGQCLFEHALVQNHYPPNPTYPLVDQWLDTVNAKNKPAINRKEAYEYLKKAVWQIDGDGTWTCQPVGYTEHPKYMPTTKLNAYKEILWRKGILEHDDVLYLAYIILQRYPSLAEHLGAKFPYIYVDEFQDTDPRQTQVLKWIAEASNAYIGVIGDSEQAIFGFCGAKRQDFIDFNLPGIKQYTIADNRRSTDNIIAVLNNARTDGIHQKGLRNTEGSRVALLVGDISKAYEHVKNTQPVMLARSNEEAAILRAKDFTKQPTQAPWSQLEDIDAPRYFFVKAVLESHALIRSGNPGSAVRKFLDEFRVRKGESDVLTNAPYITDATRRALALTVLCCMEEHYPSLCNKPFLQTYDTLSEQIAKLLPGTRLKKIIPGRKTGMFAQTFTLQQLLDTVVMVDDTRDAKTIHKAKGAEFDSVLLYLPSEADLDKILTPNAAPQQSKKDAEEQRILYVGISRARDNLCISVPTLSTARTKTIEQRKLPIEVIDL